MNRWILRLFAFCISVILLLAGCQSKEKTILPVTGAQEAVPALAALARDNVLEYLLASSRLATCPKDTDWRLEVSEGSEREFHFRNGDWLMVIWLADDENQRVMIINKVNRASWTGYVTPKGHVVDTAYYNR